ncbi:MAG TPA: methyl-accepting chemotaxis protein [Acidobacteriaceae bacterium]|jgi:aerotaxis receptor|nr:methyl-accepting chemotaxis protein [Acidobacteriaceae bacterium]
MPAFTVSVPVTNVETLVPANVFIYSRTDLKGRILEANDAFAAISGYTIDQMIGKPHNLVRHPDMPREAFADMWRALQAERPWQAVVKNRRSDGGFYWVLANASPIREQGQVVGYQSIRFTPTRDQVQAASEAYRRIREGDRSLQIVDGRVVFRKGAFFQWLFGCTTELRLSLSSSIAAASLGLAALLPTSPHPVIRPLAEIAMAGSLLLALLAWAHADRKLHHDLAAVRGYVDEILSTGNLTRRLDLGHDDCLGPVARKFSLLTAWVQATVLSMSEGVQHVQNATESVLKDVLEIDRAANSQSAATSSVAAAAQELELTIREVAENLRGTETAVGRTGQRATDGAGISQQAAEQIHHLAEAIRCAASEVEALGSTSAEVGQIAGTIREIADQTNLLALNASIEAARAGTAGRGFAVVATEVRNLADRTMKATTSINALLLKIRQDSDRAIGGMRKGAAQVADSVTMVQGAREVLTEINTLMGDAVRRVTEISNSSSQQTEAMNEISRNISQVAAMTEQNEATVRRTTELMRILSPMVDRVQKAVLQYRV